MAFRSDYPDLSEAACEQIDILFPRGSQSRLPDGSLPLERIAALGYWGLLQTIRLSPVEIRRVAGEMDNLDDPEAEARRVTADICVWLVGKGVLVDGWPPPVVRSVATPFSILSDPGKARSLIHVLTDGKRMLLQHEKEWLLEVLKQKL